MYGGWLFRTWHGRRSQAALEMLMSYGWAILVVLGAIGALAYFGVLNPANFFPDSCTLPSTSGLACMDFKVMPDSAVLLIRNGRGLDMHISNVTLGDCAGTFSVDLRDGYQEVFNLDSCSFGTKGTKIKKDLFVTYNYQGSTLSKPSKGAVVTKVA